jgi:hypothetical protein
LGGKRRFLKTDKSIVAIGCCQGRAGQKQVLKKRVNPPVGYKFRVGLWQDEGMKIEDRGWRIEDGEERLRLAGTCPPEGKRWLAAFAFYRLLHFITGKFLWLKSQQAHKEVGSLKFGY